MEDKWLGSPSPSSGSTADEELHELSALLHAVRHRRGPLATRGLMVLMLRMAMRARFRLAPLGGWRDHLLLRIENWVYRQANRSQSSLDPLYAAYLRMSEPTAKQLQGQSSRSLEWKHGPGLQVCTPVASEEDLQQLPLLAESLLHQTYPYWEWTIVLPSSPHLSAFDNMARIRADPRIRIEVVPSGIDWPRWLLRKDSAKASEYVGIVLAPYQLAPQALFRCAEAIREADFPELVFADEDSLDGEGQHGSPFFKPDWSPALAFSTDLLQGVFFTRRERVEESLHASPSAGSSCRGIRLQWIQGVRSSVHIPEVLCHIRSGRVGAQEFSILHGEWRAEAEAVREYGERLGLKQVEVRAGVGGFPLVRWARRPERKISVVIPNRDQPEVLDRCLHGLAHRTASPLEDVVVVDTGSQDPRTEEAYRRWTAVLPLRVIRRSGDFNFGAACNQGASEARGDLVLFLNNDTEVLEREWLERMVQWFEIHDVGIVGAKLLFPDGRIQHAGVILGMGGLAGHLFYGAAEFGTGMFGSDHWYRDLSAVTGACMLVSREVFEGLGGFDEKFRVVYQDIDLCLRARDKGRRIIFTPDARLIHHEGLTHQNRIPRADFLRAQELWSKRGWLTGDPFFNPNLSYVSPVPELRWADQDMPLHLSHRLLRRLPRKEIVQVPGDLR
ncbi:MAG: glycosyltransferase family 2 protein [Anaerolineales bacterium]